MPRVIGIRIDLGEKSFYPEKRRFRIKTEKSACNAHQPLGRITRDGWIGPPWIRTSPAKMIFRSVRRSGRQIASNPRAEIPRVIIADRWDFFTLVAGSSIR